MGSLKSQLVFLLFGTVLICSINCIRIEVSTADGLRFALGIASPGDIINLADGHYHGPFVAVRNGTAIAPILLSGSQNATLSYEVYGFHLTAHHWILRGFTVTRSLIGVVIDYGNNNIVEHLTVHDMDQEGIHLRFGSSDNIIRHNRIYNLGVNRPGYGEGIYIGRSRHAWVNMTEDKCDRNQMLYNHIGPDVRGESIDIKEGTCCGLIEGNTFDGRGMTNVNFDDAWVDMKGENYLIQNNTGFWTLKDGFWISNELPAEYNKTSACNNVFRNNFCDLQAGGFCIAHNGTAELNCGNIIYSSNQFINGGGLTDGVVTSDDD